MAFDIYDSVSTSPTNVFATFNPLFNGYGTSAFSNGNLYVGGDGVNWTDSIANFYVSSGKWYWECAPYDQYIAPGIADITFVPSSSGHVGSNQFTLYGSTGTYGGDASGSAASFNSTNIIGFLLDMDSATRTLKYYKDNSLIGTVNLPTGYTQVAPILHLSGSTTAYTKFNFGQDHTFGGYPNSLASSSGYSDANGIGSFYYQPPADALALCTANLPDPDIDPAVDDLPEDNFKAVIWTGIGDHDRKITVGTFLPDLIWVKNRDTAVSHTIYDSLRGYGDNKILHSDATNAESAGGASGYIAQTSSSDNSFTFDGTSESGADLYYTDRTGDKFCAWCFRAGGSPSGSNIYMKNDVGYQTLSAAGITAGTITPAAMSVNTKAGFSIVKYTGTGSAATVPHGLSAKVEFSIVKVIDLAGQVWSVYHKDAGGGLILNLTNAAGSSYDHSASGDNLVSLASGWDGVNGSNNYIMYCWHSVAGYSAFGSYTGNGSTDGPFVYTGFKPAWVMIKLSSTTTTVGGTQAGSWAIFDNVRSTNNPVDGSNVLWANQSSVEGTRGSGSGSLAGIETDFLSNGFKIKNSGAELNLSGETFIYSAFAEMPSKYAATNAR